MWTKKIKFQDIPGHSRTKSELKKFQDMKQNSRTFQDLSEPLSLHTKLHKYLNDLTCFNKQPPNIMLTGSWPALFVTTNTELTKLKNQIEKNIVLKKQKKIRFLHIQRMYYAIHIP